MKRAVGFFAAACLLAVLPVISACSGGGGNPVSGVPATIAPTAANAHTMVTFTIAVPPKTTSSKTRPAYVSPATQSMTISVLQGSTSVVSETVGLTANSTGCTSSLAGVTCTLQLALSPGSYTASITTYDGTNATGNALSTAQDVAFTVTAGQNNLVPISLSGIPASVAVTALSSTSVNVVAKDADGNYIVGSGAPVYTATKTSGSTVVTINQPTTTQPNIISFVVPSPAPSPGIETIGVTASFPSGQTNGCAGTGASCAATTSITATYEGTLWVPNHGGTDIFGFSLPITSNVAPAYSLAVSGGIPEAIAVDANGDLFSDSESHSGNGTFQEFAYPNFNVVATNTQGGGSNFNMAVAPNGDAAAGGAPAGSVNGAFLLFESPYTGTPTTLQNGIVNALAVGPDSTFYGGYSNNSVTAYVAPYTSSSLPTVTASGNINDMLVYGNELFVSENTSIDVFALPLTQGETPTVTIPAPTTFNQFYGLAVDSSGDLWLAAYSGGANTCGGNPNSCGGLLEYKPPFTASESPSVAISAPFGSDASYNPYGLQIDGNGNVYVATSTGGAANGAILQFSPPVSSSSTPAVVIDTSNFSTLTTLTLGPPKLVLTL
jgi:hypothetical protein